MRNRIAACAILLGAICGGRPGTASACSQCLCGSPTPPGYLLSDVGAGFRLGLEERYLAKVNALEEVAGEEKQFEHRVSGLLSHRLGDRVALQAQLPYVFKRNTRAPAGEAKEITHGHGVGDAGIIARFDALRFGNVASRSGMIAPVALVGIPTGSNESKDEGGLRLDEHLQPGTGAWSGTAGIAMDVGFETAAISASVLARANGTNGHGYRYGNAVLFNAGYARTLSTSWQAGLAINGRNAARDRVGDGSRDPNSGGTVLYAAPDLRWTGLGDLAIDLLVQVPVVQALYGDQTERTTAKLALTWSAR